MVEITLEAILIGVGWVTALLFGVFVALYITAPAAKRLVLAAMTDPKGEVQALRAKERLELEAMLDGKLAGLKLPTPDLSNLAIKINLGEIRAMMDEVISNHLKAAKARGGRLDDNGDADRVRQAAENPEGANMLQFAIRALDSLANMKIITKATAKDYISELKDEFARTGDITNLAKSFGVNFANFTPGGGSGSHSGRSAGPV